MQHAVESVVVNHRLVSYPAATGTPEWGLLIVGHKPIAVYRLGGMTSVEESFSAEEQTKTIEFCSVPSQGRALSVSEA